MKHQNPARQWLIGLLGYLLLWTLVTSAKGYYIGIPVSMAAAALHLHLRANRRKSHHPTLRWRHSPAFLIFFIPALVRGGWDVARRALTPRLPIDPAWVNYTMQCQHRRTRMALSALVGLLPGTLASGFDADQLHLHVLDQKHDWMVTLEQLEQHLAILYNDPASPLFEAPVRPKRTSIS